MKKIKDMTQEEIEDEVCDRLYFIDDNDEFVRDILCLLVEPKESMIMMLTYMRDKGESLTRRETINAAFNIYHKMND